MADQAISIQYEKTLDWLASRNKLPHDWFADLHYAQAAAAKAVVALKTEESTTTQAIQELLTQHAEEFDYIQASEMHKLLEQSSSPAAGSWKQVLEIYRKKNAYLAEAARSLSQLVRYDIPVAKAQAQACRKQAQDGERRQQDLRRREADARKTLRDLCESLQVQGEDPKAEIQQRVRAALPEALERAAGLVAERCSDPIAFYCSFSRYVLEDNSQPEENVLPMVRLVIAKGNVLVKDVNDVNQCLKAEWQTVIEEAETQGGANSTRLLASSRARVLLGEQLSELDAFLAQRSAELEHSSQAELAEDLQRSPEEVRQFQAGVAEALEALCGKEVQMLLRYHNSEAILDQAASKIAMQKALCERPGREAAELESRSKQLNTAAEASLGEVSRLRERCQQLKAHLEEEIGQLMKHKVCLVGDVSTV